MGIMGAFITAKPEAVDTAGYRIASAILCLFMGLTLASCAVPPPPLASADPADPNARVAAVGYRSTTAPYTRVRPVEPSSQRPPGQ